MSVSVAISKSSSFIFSELIFNIEISVFIYLYWFCFEVNNECASSLKINACDAILRLETFGMKDFFGHCSARAAQKVQTYTSVPVWTSLPTSSARQFFKNYLKCHDFALEIGDFSFLLSAWLAPKYLNVFLTNFVAELLLV